MVEYAYIHTLNWKVVGLRPATQAGWSAVLAPADYDGVLNRLRAEGRWEPVNPKFRPAHSGASLVRIWRNVPQEPEIPSDVREERVEIRSDLQDSELQEIRHEKERNGWNLNHVVGKDRKAEFMTMVFTKPKTAPE